MPVGLKLIGLSGSPEFELTVSVGSDDFTEDLRRDRAGVVQGRDGVTLSIRNWMLPRVWTYNVLSETESYMKALRTFWEAGVFEVYPDISNTAVKYTVVWEDGGFNPVPVGIDKYSIKASFKETTVGAGTPAIINPVGNQTINGNLTVNGNADITGTLAATIVDASTLLSGGTNLTNIFVPIGGSPTFDDIRANGNIYVNYDGPEGDSHIYFWNSLDPEGTSLTFDETISALVVSGSNFGVAGNVSFGVGKTSIAHSYCDNDAVMLYNTTAKQFQFSREISVISIESAGQIHSVGAIEGDSWIRANTSIIANTHMYINHDGTITDASLYFHDGTSVDGAYLTFDNTADEFTLSHQLNVDGSLNVTSNIVVTGTVTTTSLISCPTINATGQIQLGGSNIDGRYIRKDDPWPTTLGGLTTPGANDWIIWQDSSSPYNVRPTTISSLPISNATLSALDEITDPTSATTHSTSTATIPAGVGTGFGVPLNLSVAQGTTADSEWIYEITVSTLNTGSKTGAKYIAWYDVALLDTPTSGWTTQAVSLAGTSSNHPQLFYSGDNSTFYAYNNHATAYDIRYFVEANHYEDDDFTPNVLGADYGWTRLVDTLAFDGTVSASTYVGIEYTKGAAIIEPQVNDEFSLWFVERQTTFSTTRGVVRGTSPSVTWRLMQDSNRNGSGTIVNSGITTSIGTGDFDSTMINAVIPANKWLWLEITATGGTIVDEFSLGFQYKED